MCIFSRRNRELAASTTPNSVSSLEQVILLCCGIKNTKRNYKYIQTLKSKFCCDGYIACLQCACQSFLLAACLHQAFLLIIHYFVLPVCLHVCLRVCHGYFSQRNLNLGLLYCQFDCSFSCLLDCLSERLHASCKSACLRVCLPACICVHACLSLKGQCHEIF